MCPDMVFAENTLGKYLFARLFKGSDNTDEREGCFPRPVLRLYVGLQVVRAAESREHRGEMLLSLSGIEDERMGFHGPWI